MEAAFMLLLSRKVGERFVVHTPGGDVWVTVVAVDRGRARIGIEAPQEYRIYREELLEQREWQGSEDG
jgi:carbon storage regulator CsrA